MEDSLIVELYWKRDESAIRETESKYERYLTKIAYNVLSDLEDSRESVNETYFKAWNSMPPHRPDLLSAYLGKITRQLSIDIYRKKNCARRRGSEYDISLSELEECVSDGSTPEQETELLELADAISTYLRTLPEKSRDVFVCRYFFLDSIQEIAAFNGVSGSNIKSLLHRTRLGLKKYLEKEGFIA